MSPIATDTSARARAEDGAVVEHRRAERRGVDRSVSHPIAMIATMSRRRRRTPTDRTDWPRLVPPLAEQAPPADRLRSALASGHWSASSLAGLAENVGGVERLAGLTAEPLPRSEIDPEQYAEPVRSTVRSILAAFEGRPSWMTAGEEHSIIHRLVERLAAQPEVLSSGEPVRTAAALVWLLVRSRDPRDRPDLGWVWSVFGVPPSAARAHALYRALGFATGEQGVKRRALPDPALMAARDRQRIIELRDRFLDEFDRHLRAVEAAKPIRHVGDGRLTARGGVIRPVWAAQGTIDGVGRRMVMLAVDRVAALDQPPRDDARPLDDVDEVISLSVPDAWTLLRQLQHALANPATAP